jgi:hypothetical protein
VSQDLKTIKPASAGTPFRAAEHLRNEADIALYIEEMLADGYGSAHCVDGTCERLWVSRVAG